jgi:hypothetical protein
MHPALDLPQRSHLDPLSISGGGDRTGAVAPSAVCTSSATSPASVCTSSVVGTIECTRFVEGVCASRFLLALRCR